MNDLLHHYTPLSVDHGSRTVRFGGKEIVLSPREFAILAALIERPGTPVSRMQLRERLYGTGEPQILGNPVQVHIHNLRAKLGEEVIQTLRGAGYVVKASWLAPTLVQQPAPALTLGRAS